MRPVAPMDGSRSSCTVVLDEHARVARRHGAGTGRSSGRCEEATVALALEMVGTCQTIFDITLDYAKNRHQFGVPIGSFQAVKHKLANMVVALERARATCYFAAATIAEDDPRRSLADVDGQGRRRRRAAPRRRRTASSSSAASATRGSTTCTST